jgi:hypothetical protein
MAKPAYPQEFSKISSISKTIDTQGIARAAQASWGFAASRPTMQT